MLAQAQAPIKIEVPKRHTKSTNVREHCVEFGKRLGQLITINEMSLADLGRKIGVSRSGVHSWTSGKTYPSVDKLHELCDIFDTSISWLLSGVHSVESTSANVSIPIQGSNSESFITLPLDFVAMAENGPYHGLKAIQTGERNQIAVINPRDFRVDESPKTMLVKDDLGGGQVVKAYLSKTKSDVVVIETGNSSKEIIYKPGMFIGSVSAVLTSGQVI